MSPGERIAFGDGRHRPASTGPERCVENLRLLASAVMGYDVPGEAVDEAIADLHGICSDPECRPDLLAGEDRLLRLFADLRALTRPRHDADDPAQVLLRSPAGVLPLVPALARPGGRGAAGALHVAAAAGPRPLRHRGHGSHPRPRGGLLPAVPLPAAARRRSARRCWRSSTGAWSRPTSSRRVAGDDFREMLARLGAAMEGRDPAIADLVRAGPLPLLRRAGDRGGPRGRLRRDAESTSTRSPRSPTAPTARNGCGRSWPARRPSRAAALAATALGRAPPGAARCSR